MAPVQTLSTGQTAADIAGLLELYQLLSQQQHADVNSTSPHGLKAPPALFNPNYRPPNEGPRDVALFLMPTLLAIIFMAIRMSVRWNSRSGNWSVLPEDWLLVFGFICTISNGLMMTIGVHIFQFGMAVYDMKISSLQSGLKVSYAFQIIYICAIAFIRLSLILFIKRLYTRVSKVMRYVCDALMFVTIAIAVGCAITLALQCKPFASSFDIFKKVVADCMGPRMYTSIAILNILADVAVAALPLNLVYRMKALSTRKRVEVVVMFSLGLLACVAAIVRFAFLNHTVQSSNRAYYGRGSSVNTALCCQWEICVAIITACVPQAKMVFTRITSSSNTPTSTITPQQPSKIIVTSNSALDRRYADKKTMNNTINSTISSNSDSIDYWTPATLEQGKLDRARLEAGLPMKGRTRSEEAEEIYSKLPTALPKTIPPWMVGAKSKTTTKAEDEEIWELHETRMP